ncbi:hypothetical protein ACFL0Q_02010 [Thermodesulfobacteriota bacterium]
MGLKRYPHGVELGRDGRALTSGFFFRLSKTLPFSLTTLIVLVNLFLGIRFHETLAKSPLATVIGSTLSLVFLVLVEVVLAGWYIISGQFEPVKVAFELFPFGNSYFRATLGFVPLTAFLVCLGLRASRDIPIGYKVKLALTFLCILMSLILIWSLVPADIWPNLGANSIDLQKGMVTGLHTRK